MEDLDDDLNLNQSEINEVVTNIDELSIDPELIELAEAEMEGSELEKTASEHGVELS
jgi:hypothetical protein